MNVNALSELKFAVDTTELERAQKVISGLAQDFTKIDRVSQQAAKTQAQTDKLLAQAAKEHAQARKANADAADKEIKTIIAVDKADASREKTVRKNTKAVDDQSNSLSRLDSLMRKTIETTAGMTEGLSKAQAAKIADAKAFGATNEQLEILISNLQTQRKLQGKEPFDNSASGALLLKNALTELNAANRLYGSGLELTSKQAKDLARDQLRLIESAKARGDSIFSVRDQLRKEQDDYVKLANQYNRAFDAEQRIIKSRTDLVKATQYVATEDEKMAAALSKTNLELDRASKDKLVKYETNLKKMGLAQDIVSQRLGSYKTQLEQVRKLEQARAEQFLTRALAPQASDVVVSLWSGQNPLTVLLQQGSQINDVFMQSGVAAERFGEVVKKSMASMLPSILTVAKGVGGLIVDGFVAAGNAANNFLARSVGVAGALDAAYSKASENGPSQYAGKLKLLSTILTGITSATVAVFAAALAGLAVALVQVTKEHNELVKSLNLTGAALGLTADSAVTLSQSISGIRTTDAVEFIQELSKAGASGSDNLAELTRVAVDLEKYGGVALKDTAKAYDDLQSKPFEGLMKIAEGTGQVAKETVDLAIKLKLAGDEVGLLKLANDEFISANKKVTDSIKAEINPMSALWITVKEGIGFAWEGLKDFARTGVVLDTFIGSLRVIATGALAIGAIFRGLGKTIAMAFSVYAETASAMNPFSSTTKDQAVNNIKTMFSAYKDDMSDWKKGTDDAFNAIWQRTEKTTGLTAAARAENSAYARDSVKGVSDLEKAYGSIEKSELKKLTRQQAINKALEDYKQKNKQAGEYQLSLISAGAGIAWDKAQTKPKKDPTESYYNQLMKQATDNTIKATLANEDYTKSELILLQAKADPRWDKMSNIQQKDIEQKYEGAIAAEKQVQAEERANSSRELANKLLGKRDMLGKDYYKNLEEIAKYEKLGVENGGYSVEQAEKLRQAAFDQTELAKTRLKIEEDSAKVVEKYKDESEKASVASQAENTKLDDRLALLGLTSEQQKELTREQERRNKLAAISAKLAQQEADVWERWGKGEFGVNGATKARAIIADMYKQAGEDAKIVNQEVSVQYAEDLDKEIRAIKSGITDSIVTALFDGGKAGSKKIRDLITNSLRQKFTIVVDALVNNLIGGVANSVVGSAGSSLLSSAATSAGGSMITGAMGLGSLGAVGGVIQGFSTAALAATQSMLGITGTTAQMATSLTAAGHTAAAGVQAGTSLFAAIPGWGWAAMAALAVAAVFKHNATPHAGAAATYSAAGGLQEGAGVYNYNTVGMGLTQEYNKNLQASVSPIAKTIGQTLDAVATSFGKKAGYEIATAFADDTSKDGAWGSLIIKQMGAAVLNWQDTQTSRWAPKEFANAEEGYKQYLAAVALDTRQVLLNMDLPSWAKDIFTAIGESPSMEQLTAAVQTIGQVQTVFASFGQYMLEFANLADSAQTALVNASGGIQSLTANMSSFVDNFYTDAEKLAVNTQNVTDALAKLGFEMPKTREEFKKIVESQIALGEDGAKAAASLLSLSGAVSSVLPAFEEVSSGIKEVSDNIEDVIASLRASIAESLPAVIKKYAKGNEWDLFQYEQIARNLVTAKIAFTDISTAMQYLTSATKDDIGKAAADLFNMGNLSLDQKKVLIDSASLLADIKDSSVDLADTITTAFKNAGTDIVAYLRELTTGRAGLATPMEVLNKSREVYNKDYSAALGGDADAAKRLTDSAKSYIDAQKVISASSSITNDVIKTIVNQLSSLGFVQDVLSSNNAPFIPQFADGGAFTNSVVSKPTLFNIGQMGEAGPEAILPLAKTSSGALGVQTAGEGNKELLAAILAELQALREQQSTETSQVVTSTIQVAEMLVTATEDSANANARRATSKLVLN